MTSKKREKNNVFLIAGTIDSNSIMENTKKLLNLLTSSSSIILCTSCSNIKIEDPNVLKIIHGRYTVPFPVDFMINQITLCLNILQCKRDFDINLVFLAFNHDLDFFPIFLCKLLNIPIIIRSDGRNSLFIKFYSKKPKYFRYFVYKFLEEINYRQATVLLTESEYMLNFYNFDKYRQSLVGNLFVDLKKFSLTKPSQHRKYTFGFVGRFSHEKGILEFGKALMQLQKTYNFTAIIIGEGELEKKLKTQVNYTTSNQGDIEILPWIDNQKLPDYLNDIKILVVPSKKEGLPNIILEAMACGTIVLASDVGGVPSIIHDRKTGFLLDNNTSEGIANNLVMIMNFPDLGKIIEQAKTMIEKDYSFEAAQQNLLTAMNKYHIIDKSGESGEIS